MRVGRICSLLSLYYKTALPLQDPVPLYSHILLHFRRSLPIRSRLRHRFKGIAFFIAALQRAVFSFDNTGLLRSLSAATTLITLIFL